MSALIKTYEFIPSKAEQQEITVLFCLNKNDELHTLYVSHFLPLCVSENIICKALYFTPTSAEQCLAFLHYTPCSFIVCLDNNYLPHLTSAHTKLFLSAPLICVDWAAPVTPPALLPQQCFFVTPTITVFVEQFCNLILYMPTIRKVGILYCPQDPILMPLLPTLEGWLTQHSYTTKAIKRTPSITGADVVLFADFDLIIFLCRNAPQDYMTRLATVCKEQQTILYVSSPAAIGYGAPCAFGPNLKGQARATLQVIRSYLSNTPPQPIQVDYEISINKNEVNIHPLLAPTLSPLISLAKNTTVIAPATADKVLAYLRLEQVPLE